MKIRILTPTEIGLTQLQAGQQLEVTRDIGKELVRKGKAISDEFVTIREEIALKEENKLLGLPLEELLKEIKKTKSEEILLELTNDKRKKVREAALKQIEKTESLTKN